MPDRVRPVSDPAAYFLWALAHRRCMACGVPYYHAGRLNSGLGLQTHHIIKFGRSDETANLLRLCPRDHNLAEGLAVRRGGALLPTLSLGQCLWLKNTRNPGDWHPERLAQLRGQALPDLEEPPAFLGLEWRRWLQSPV